MLDFDPRARHTIWNLSINSILAGITQFGTNQVSVMRALTLGSDKQIIKYVNPRPKCFFSSLWSVYKNRVCGQFLENVERQQNTS